MKVFVAGATGVIGHRAVRELVAAGHDVTAVARGKEKAALVRSLGAAPVEVDLFDVAVVKEAVTGHEAVVNLTTKIPPLARAARPGAWKENDRIRREVSRNLTDACLAHGIGRYVQESITFTYVDRNDEWIDEDTPVEAPAFADAVLEAEANAARVPGVVLRFGMFYAADSTHSQDTLRLARRGMSATVGRADAYVSMIHADDAASAVVAALEAPPGTYNVVDDEPLTRREQAETVGAAVGRGHIRLLPAAVARAGGSKARFLARSQRVSNRRFKETTGWSPSVPTSRDGWHDVAAAIQGEGTR